MYCSVWIPRPWSATTLWRLRLRLSMSSPKSPFAQATMHSQQLIKVIDKFGLPPTGLGPVSSDLASNSSAAFLQTPQTWC